MCVFSSIFQPFWSYVQVYPCFLSFARTAKSTYFLYYLLEMSTTRAHTRFSRARIINGNAPVCNVGVRFPLHLSHAFFVFRLFAFSLTVQYDPSFNWNVDLKISSNINAENFEQMDVIVLLFFVLHTFVLCILKCRFHTTVSAYLQLIFTFARHNHKSKYLGKCSNEN